MPKSKQAKLAAAVRNLGFDKSRVEDGSVKIACSQCEAIVINGVPCHEHGCPNYNKERR